MDIKSAKEFFESEVRVFEGIQKELQKIVTKRQQLESQLHENQLVQDQLKKLRNESKVYKLIGPVLVPQELVEAKSNVEKRMEYIRGEITRVERSLKESAEKEEKKRQELMALQSKFQAQMEAQQQQQQPAAVV
eukprot:Partr_v1_DN24873_c1_g1_i1_m29892 putative prefoldin subunit 6